MGLPRPQTHTHTHCSCIMYSKCKVFKTSFK